MSRAAPLKTVSATVFAVIILWSAVLFLRKVDGPLAHNSFDQHTRQAAAWLQGRVDIEPASWLEIAEYKNRFFNSFPPVPTLVEVFWRPLFGDATPSYLSLLLASLAPLLFAIVRTRRNTLDSVLITTGILFGTNIATSLAVGGAWGEGQLYGYALAAFAFLRIGLGTGFPGAVAAYFCLGLAVGCRPLDAVYFPALWVLDVTVNQRSPRRWGQAMLLGVVPVASALMTYNYVRFENPLEFGHAYLPWSRQLADGIFSLAYLPRNAWHAFLNLPTQPGPGGLPFEFHGRGTAFWLNNIPLLVGLWLFARSKLSTSVKAVTLSCAALLMGTLLLHESNGWMQFGWRYSIDLLPIATLGFFLAPPLPRWAWVAILIWSIPLNLYGIAWFNHHHHL